MENNCELFVLFKEYPRGGKIWLMLGLDNSSSDYDDLLAIAKCLAENGHDVKILHAVHYKDPLYQVVFGDLMGTKYYRKCPDLLVDDDFVEYESYTTDQPKRAFRNMIHNGMAQSDRVIIRHCNLTDGYMTQQIRGQIQNGAQVSCVWLFDGESIRILFTEG